MLSKMAPEFATMSLKPGIGALHIDKINKDLLENEFYEDYVIRDLKHGKDRKMPLGRYLFGRLNHGKGLDDQIDYENWSAMYEEVFKGIENEVDGSYREGVLKANEVKRNRREKRQRIRKKRESLGDGARKI